MSVVQFIPGGRKKGKNCLQRRQKLNFPWPSRLAPYYGPRTCDRGISTNRK